MTLVMCLFKLSQIQFKLIVFFIESSCTRLYSDIRITSKSNFACEKDENGQKVCKCTHNGTCPEHESLKRIEKEFEQEINLSEVYGNFKRYVCYYRHVIIGKVIQIDTQQQHHVLTIESQGSILGDVEGNLKIALGIVLKY